MDNSQAPLPLLPGARVREFRITRLLGEGSFGIVYAATHEILGETVAIKEFLPRQLARRTDGNRIEAMEGQTEAYEWARERFLREARTLKALADPEPHPNLVQVIHAFPENDTVYMCMRYEDGVPLDRLLLREGPLDEHRLRTILLPLLDGLEHAHAQGVWHRDIKPSNILIRGDGSPVLIDFGAARQEIGNRDQSVMAQCTPGYAAPEQLWGGDEQGPWTDIYALGATLYRAITGKPPQGFSRTNLQQDYSGRYSADLLAAVDAALEPKPDARPQTIGEWRQRFGQGPVDRAGTDEPTRLQKTGPLDATQVVVRHGPATVRSAPGQASRPPPAAGEPPGRPRIWRWAAPAVVAAAVAIGAGLWWWSVQPPTTPPVAGGPARPLPREETAHRRPPAEPSADEIAQGGDLSVAASEVARSSAGAPGPASGAAADERAGATGQQPGETSKPTGISSATQPGEMRPRAEEAPRAPGTEVEEPDARRRHDPSASMADTGRSSELTPKARTETLAMIEDLVNGLACSRIDASLSPRGAVTLKGFAGDTGDLEGLRARLLSLQHVRSVRDDGVEIQPWPFCEVIALLGDALQGGYAAGLTPSVRLNKADAQYRQGEYLMVTAMSNSPRDGYLYVDYVDTSGNVVHMLPAPTQTDNAVAAWGRIVIGADSENACLERQCYEISPPHGRGLLVVVWSLRPLIPGHAGEIEESATDYFASLASRIRSASIGGAQEVAVGYRFLETRR